MELDIELQGADDVFNALNVLATAYPKEADKFLKSEANTLRTKVRSLTRQKVRNTSKKKKKKTYTTLLEGVKRSKKPYTNEDDRIIRVYNSARHAHLIEYGHVTRNPSVRTREFLLLKHSEEDFKNQYIQDANTFVEGMLKK